MASQINIKAKLMDEAEIRYEKELEELACKNAVKIFPLWPPSIQN